MRTCRPTRHLLPRPLVAVEALSPLLNPSCPEGMWHSASARELCIPSRTCGSCCMPDGRLEGTHLHSDFSKESCERTRVLAHRLRKDCRRSDSPLKVSGVYWAHVRALQT